MSKSVLVTFLCCFFIISCSNDDKVALTNAEDREIGAYVRTTETVNADFRHAATFTELEPVDASILFEVLLHQENYSEIVRNVTSTSNKFVCVAQPCLREEWFPLPSSSTLLQFWDEELKDEIRRDSFWPEEERATTFTSGSWMWGHTTSHLIDLFGGYGWSLEHGEVISNVCGVHWEYPLLVFRSPA